MNGNRSSRFEDLLSAFLYELREHPPPGVAALWN